MVIILHERSECRRNFREPPENGLPGNRRPVSGRLLSGTPGTAIADMLPRMRVHCAVSGVQNKNRQKQGA